MEVEQQLTKEKISPKSYVYPLFNNLQQQLLHPPGNGSTYLAVGDFNYFHYGCDFNDDSGWGCAYRTLQTTCSWILSKRNKIGDLHVPSIPEIQEVLVEIGDKPKEFIGSRDWIGAMEVFYVIDALYDVPCKILHIRRCEELKKYSNVIKKYFEDFGGFIMMGGDVDAASKGIAGVHISGNQAYFLIIDPHFVGVPKNVQELIERGYIRWQHSSEFIDSSFYNLCLPQIK